MSKLTTILSLVYSKLPPNLHRPFDANQGLSQSTSNNITHCQHDLEANVSFPFFHLLGHALLDFFPRGAIFTMLSLTVSKIVKFKCTPVWLFQNTVNFISWKCCFGKWQSTCINVNVNFNFCSCNKQIYLVKKTFVSYHSICESTKSYFHVVQLRGYIA